MSLHIVIDGYNLIRQSRQFSALDRQDLQSGRDALIDALAAYKKIKGYTITVVFDGAQAPSHMHRRDIFKGIELRYSNPRELADTVIKRLVAREKQKLLVVTSDNDIVRYAQSMGAAVIPSAEFEERLIMADQMDLDHVESMQACSEGWPATTRKKGPSRRLPKRRRQMDKRLSKL